MTHGSAPSSQDALKAGREAARELACALRDIGHPLPSIDGDFPVHGLAMVRLGGCSAAAASRLAQWLREHG
ncbi:hypothetical protein ACFV3R_03230 [Streptomyces sp. NPDC059740]|uniref:hypothetical protein n=1 Tax=Streptomyces sp. NPDC059740 TaxID=3346926 RepID=UPI00366636E1